MNQAEVRLGLKHTVAVLFDTIVKRFRARRAIAVIRDFLDGARLPLARRRAHRTVSGPAPGEPARARRRRTISVPLVRVVVGRSAAARGGSG
jgi:hypothetical protein